MTTLKRNVYILSGLLHKARHALENGLCLDGYPEDDLCNYWTADFGDGLEVDVKLVNALTENGGAWTEAVLFKNGHELTHTDVLDSLDTFELEYAGVTYVVQVRSADNVPTYNPDDDPWDSSSIY